MFYVLMFIGAAIVIPVWEHYSRVTRERLERGNIILPKKPRRKGPPPPPDRLPIPLVGSMLERRAARRILP